MLNRSHVKQNQDFDVDKLDGKLVLTLCLLIGKPVYKLVAESKGP